MLRLRSLFAFLAVATTLLILASSVDARPSRGGSMGSRGSNTFSAPAPTATAPNAAAPMQRTMTQAPRPGATAAAAPAAGGMFGRFGGFGGGLMAGLLGAGLFGMLMGNGMFGGLGGFASILGLVLQVALIAIVARLAWAWWQRRNAPATAAGPSFLRDAAPDPNRNAAYYGSGAAPYGGGAAAASAVPTSDITLDKADYDDFERLLSEVSLAYGAADLGKLRSRATPEMLSYFSEELAASASRGHVNEVSDVKLLQGDLSEAWRESSTEYATLAMRYAITDATIESATGQVVEGSRTPQEVTELWTFMRSPGGQWILSAIQQA